MLLTDTKIKSLKLAPGRKEQFFSDGKGLYLRLREGGTRVWMYRFTYAGKKRKVFLGPYPEVGLSAARDKRLAHAKILESDQNPALVKEKAVTAKRDAMTVEDLAKDFNERILKKRYKKPEDAYARLLRDPVRVLGRYLAMDITPEMITKQVFNKMIDRDARVAANRTLALTRQMFDYAVAQHIIDANPVTLRPKDAGGKEESKKTNLQFEQIKDFLDLLGSNQNPMRDATKYALLTILGTAKRPLEVVTAEWSHMDLKNAKWVNPWHLTKDKIQGKDHIVFLSQWMVTILKHLKAMELSEKYVFPSPQKHGPDEAPLRRHTLSESLLRLQEVGLLKFKFTPHDLRRTFSTRAANLKIQPHVVEKCLDHAMTGMMAVYNQADYFEERKEAMEVWGAKLQTLCPV